MTHVYVDAMNWLGRFWSQRSGRQKPWRELNKLQRNVKDFVNAANATGIRLTVVADDVSKSAEALSKWYKRREREMRTENRNMPLRIDFFLTEAFESHGVRVLRPHNVDADDLLAALASNTGGIVLSTDRDFFRYVPAIRVSREYKVTRGRLVLDKDEYLEPRVSMRIIDPGLVSAAAGLTARQVFVEGFTYRRGTSSSSDKMCGSLHSLSRPLWAAVLYCKGVSSIIQELPEWDAERGTVVWNKTTICADGAHSQLLRSVPGMVRYLEERDVPLAAGWRRTERQFNTHAVAASLHVYAFGGSMTEQMLKAAGSPSYV